MVSITRIINNSLSSMRSHTLGRFHLHGNQSKTDYKLLERLDRADVTSIDRKVWLPPKKASSFSLVRVGKKSDSNFVKEVMTYFDKDGKIVERLFRQDGINTKQRLYSYGNSSREIVTREFKHPDVEPGVTLPKLIYNMAGQWRNRVSELQIFESYPGLAALVAPKYNGKIPIRVFSRKIEYVNPKDINSVRKYRFTHSHVNLGIEEPNCKKVVSGTIYKNGKNIELKDVSKTDNLDLNLDDEFLKYRFIDPRSDEGMKLISDYYIKQKGLEPLSIRVFPSSGSIIEHETLGYFSNGEIHYSKRLQDFGSEKAIDTAAHEVEHAYQHAQIGRLGKGKSSYETEAERVLPKIKLSELEEAVQYSIASSKYPRSNLTFSNPLYRDNYLEVKAREAGKKASELYRADENNFKFFDFFYK